MTKGSDIDNIKHKMNNKTMEQAKKEPEVAIIDATLSDAEVKNVIDAVEPIIKTSTIFGIPHHNDLVTLDANYS